MLPNITFKATSFGRSEALQAAPTLAVMNSWKLFLLFLFLVASTGVCAGTRQREVQVTGVFSDLAYSARGGDTVGSEIILVYGDSGYQVLLQCATGRMGEHQLLQAIVEYPEITFTVPDDTPTFCPKGKFHGVLSKRGLQGTVRGLGWPSFLPRKRSYWQ